MDKLHPERTMLIGVGCTGNLRQHLIKFLQANMDCFSWSHDDKMGIDPSIITHKLSVDPKCKPIQERRRKFAAERNKVINQEVDSFLTANKIREVKYLEWLSNVVVVPKKNGKWRRGIEANIEQVKAVLQLESPEKPKDVQRLAGKIADLSRFISRYSDKCRLFYDILRKSQKFEWTADHEQAFRELKHYLSNPPLLSKPEPGEPLFLYLVVTEVAVSAVLVREQDKEKKPVYYVSKSLLLAEISYQVTSTGRLCVRLQPNYPEPGRRRNLDPQREQGDRDLADEHRRSLQLEGAGLALELGVRNLQISSDSLLIVNHVNDEFIAKDSKMIAYLKVAKELKQKFKTCKLKQISSDQNVEADALATLGATFKPTELSSIPIVHMLEPSIQKADEVDRGELEDQQDELAVQTTTEARTAAQPGDQSANQAADRTPDQIAT
ncbi:uncharacterized protein LOC141589801 [Silene latifolia]|uniref:uncharacterized protein LOC141589801 n=1 Tax=Silene latifolia TaxID=37657 RepID=UPI003D7772C7